MKVDFLGLTSSYFTYETTKYTTLHTIEDRKQNKSATKIEFYERYRPWVIAPNVLRFHLLEHITAFVTRKSI